MTPKTEIEKKLAIQAQQPSTTETTLVLVETEKTLKSQKIDNVGAQPIPLFELVYMVFVKKQKLPQQSSLHFYRFQLFFIILWYTLLKPSEIGQLTKNQILYAKDHGELFFEGQRLRVCSQAQVEPKNLEKGLELVFTKQETLMGTQYSKNWLRFLNKTITRTLELSQLRDQFDSFKTKNKSITAATLREVAKERFQEQFPLHN